jgi:hypothetical protein
MLLAFASSGFAQSSSTIGTEFWFGFMPNHSTPSDRITLVAASPTPAKVTVQVFSGDSLSVETKEYQIYPLQFGDTIGAITIDIEPLKAESRLYETPVYRCVHVSSNAPISLSAYNYQRISGEGMLVLPVTTYGKEYRTLNYPTFREGNDAFSGQYLLVSPFDNNEITIQTNGITQNGSGVETHVQGSSWKITLMRGQSYLVRSSTKIGTNPSFTDLTGSHIISTKPLAVISGHQFTKLDAPYGSTFFEMLPPVESWSRKYHYVNYDRERKSTIVIVAADSGEFYLTTENVSTPIFLTPGQRHEEEILYNEGLYAVSSTNSRFIAYELRRSRDIASDLKHFPPAMTLLTSPDDRDKLFFMNYPPLFDSMSVDVAEETDYFGSLDDILYLFPNAKVPEIHYIPRTPPNTAYLTTSGYLNAHADGYFNKKSISAMMRGTNGSASFGHTSSLRYTKRSPDEKPPYAIVNSTHCGSYDITITDDIVSSPQTVESGKLSSVRVITSDHDVTLLPPLRNYRIVRANDFVFCSQTDNFKLEVINQKFDAYAAVYVQDLAGNDTQYVFTYKAGTTVLSLSKSTGNKIPVNEQVCWKIPVYPKGDSLSAPVIIESVRLKNGLSNMTVTSITPALPQVLQIGDTLLVTVCANVADTLVPLMDSLLVFADCYERSYPVSVKGATGLLYATDASICDNKRPNKTYSTTLSLQNKGELPLSVTAFTIDGKSKDMFWLDSNWKLPQGIAKNAYYSVTVFYRPTQYSAYDTAFIYWQTDVNQPYTSSIKIVSMLTGCTVPQSGVATTVDASLLINSLSPNPAKDYLGLRYQSRSAVMVFITDELGKEVTRFEILPSGDSELSTRINLPMLPSGSYTLRLQNKEGEIASRRFVVTK